MTQSPTPLVTGAEGLPIVAWSMEGTNASFISAAAKDASSEGNWATFYTVALTPHAPAQSQIDALRKQHYESECAMRNDYEGRLKKLCDGGMGLCDQIDSLRCENERLSRELEEAKAQHARDMQAVEWCTAAAQEIIAELAALKAGKDRT